MEIFNEVKGKSFEFDEANNVMIACYLFEVDLLSDGGIIDVRMHKGQSRGFIRKEYIMDILMLNLMDRYGQELGRELINVVDSASNKMDPISVYVYDKSQELMEEMDYKLTFYNAFDLNILKLYEYFSRGKDFTIPEVDQEIRNKCQELAEAVFHYITTYPIILESLCC